MGMSFEIVSFKNRLIWSKWNQSQQMMTFAQKREERRLVLQNRGVVISYSMTVELLFNPFHHNSGEDAQSISLWKISTLFWWERSSVPCWGVFTISACSVLKCLFLLLYLCYLFNVRTEKLHNHLANSLQLSTVTVSSLCKNVKCNNL